MKDSNLKDSDELQVTSNELKTKDSDELQVTSNELKTKDKDSLLSSDPLLVTRNLLLVTDKGFTLLEVLVAFAVLSIILIALYSTFFLSRKAMEGIDDSIVKLQECRMALDVMGREIDSLVFRDGDKNTAFKLDDRDIYGKQASRIVFTSLSPLIPGLSSVSYSVEERDGKLVVLKRMNSINDPDSDTKEVEIAEDIEGFTIEAWDNGKWSKVWNAQDTRKVPEEVRITLTVSVRGRPVSLYETARPGIGRPL